MDMKEYINAETIRYYAKTNERFLRRVKGVCLEFPGLGGGSCLGGTDDLGDYDTDFAVRAANAGVLLAYVYTGPWSWMNIGAVLIADAVVDAILEKYRLSDVPVVVSGGSMGGLGALIYAASSRHAITACAAACPCCDALDRYDAADEFRKTFVSAVAGYDCPTRFRPCTGWMICRIFRTSSPTAAKTRSFRMHNWRITSPGCAKRDMMCSTSAWRA